MPTWFLRWMGFWPPLLGAGIWVREAAADGTAVTVALRLYPWNRNANGAQFGGSLFAMTDAFPTLLLMRQLGPGFVVWDKSASIEFLSPGRGTVHARIGMPPARVAEIRAAAAAGEKVLPEFDIEILDTANHVVARVHRTLYVRARREEN